MKQGSIRVWLATFARIFCGFVFVYASLDKLGEAAVFAKIITNYHILPVELVPIASVVIPWLEFFVGISLISGFRWKGAALIYCLLLAGYTFGLSFNMIRGISMTCGCFSMLNSAPVSWLTVGRDIVLLIPGVFMLLSAETRLAFPNSWCCCTNTQK